MNRRCFLLIGLSATAPFGASAASSTEPARVAATQWLGLLDNGDLDATWTQAASMFKQAVTAPKWTEAARQVRGALGATRKRQEKSAKSTRTLPGAPDGEYVLMQFDASFEKKAAAVETVTLVLDTDGRWRVAGYFVN